MEFVSMQTYKGKYDWKQELRILNSKISICRIRVNEIRIAKVIEFDPKIRLTGINSHH